MGHTIAPHNDLVMRVTYSGAIGYRERCETLVAAAQMMARLGYTRLLVDFTRATVFDEGHGSSADYIAKVISAPWPKRSRIAPLNAPLFAVQAGRIAGSVVGLVVESFDSEQLALDWLSATH